MLLILWILLLLVGNEAIPIVYTNDPSSLKLSCNPYGEVIKLPCTLQEPATLTSPLSLSVQWYWTKNEDDPYTNGHQLCPECSSDGHAKYMFEFMRYSSNETWEGGSKVIYCKLDLTIQNVSPSDSKCYYCQTEIDDTVVQNKSSGLFCIRPKSNYEHYNLCNEKSHNVSLNPVATTSPVLSILPSSSPVYTVASQLIKYFLNLINI